MDSSAAEMLPSSGVSALQLQLVELQKRFLSGDIDKPLYDELRGDLKLFIQSGSRTAEEIGGKSQPEQTKTIQKEAETTALNPPVNGEATSRALDGPTAVFRSIAYLTELYVNERINEELFMKVKDDLNNGWIAAGVIQSNPIPSVALSEALLFADPGTNVVMDLGKSDRWRDAIVLATPFWAPGDDGTKSRAMNGLINLSRKFPPLVAASMRFDPERQFGLEHRGVESIRATNRELLATLRRVRVSIEGPEDEFESIWKSLPTFLRMMPKVTWLKIDYFHLENVSALTSLTSLKSLVLDANRLQCVAGLDSLSCLEELVLDAREVKDITPLTTLPSLHSLSLSCFRGPDWSPIGQLKPLKKLAINGGDVVVFPDCPQLDCLETLSITYCSSLTSIPEASTVSLKSLNSLELRFCRQLADISGLASLTSLEEMKMDRCNAVTNLNALESLPSLTKVTFGDNQSLMDVSSIASLLALKDLVVDDARQVVFTAPLAPLTCLQCLSISYNKASDVSFLASVASLEVLELTLMVELDDISAIASLTSLQSLKLESCEYLEDIIALSSLASLRTLSLSECKRLSNTSPLAALPALEHLDLSGTAVTRGDIIPLSRLRSLKKLQVRKPKHVDAFARSLFAPAEIV